LSIDQKALLDGFLKHEFLGVHALREQAQHVLARSGCTCGCGTIDLVPDGTPTPLSDATNPVPVEGIVKGPDGSETGGLILFVRHGRLQSLEIYSYGEPLPLPPPQQVTWRA